MSLISDALKKTQAEISPLPTSSPKPPKRSFLSTMVVLGTAALFVVFLAKTQAGSRGNTAASLRERPASAVKFPKTVKSSGLNLLRFSESQWKLNGTVRGGNGESLALINDQVVAEGTELPGGKVIRVAKDSVEIQSEDGQVKTLQLE